MDTSTTFLGVADVADILSRRGVGPVLAGIADLIEQDFARWEEFDKTARVASHSTDGVIELMPIADADSYGFKYVNGHPANARFGLPTVMAFGALADVLTGTPTLVSELTLTTALRTAATSALVARYLARADARTMALIGNGAQSEFQALAFQHMLAIDRLRLYDIDPEATAKLVRNLKGSGIDVTVCASSAEAARGADIVTTVTADKRYATILTSAMVEPGMHLNAVGGDCPGKTELEAEVLLRGRVYVEFEPQSRIEGDVQQMPADFPVAELHALFRGEDEGRRQSDDITVFDSVGFALEDFSALRYLQAAAHELGLGQRIDLIARAEDPRNLYGLLAGAAVTTAVHP